jgi:hypothetical protein
MNKIDIIKKMIENGFSYDSDTGYIYGISGKKLNNIRPDGYILLSIRIDKIKYQVLGHRFAYYYVNNNLPELIDHINSIRDDNRISNLREATYQLNNRNRNSKGYIYDKSRNKWRARIKTDKCELFLGRFDTEDEARKAYTEAKKLYH